MEKAFAETFAEEWITAWNNHDLDAVLSHYVDDFEMQSPFIVRIAGESSGKLTGKVAVRKYWEAALKLMPTLHFDLISTLIGVDSVTLCYMGAKDLSAETFFFDEHGKVIKAFAHYE
ncbi:MAG: nuclear transport factor 2 family protein [Proteobacteria bacterium]|nr:nuclear transport factor 2 family protein [Pseudomonadota bacterium]